MDGSFDFSSPNWILKLLFFKTILSIESSWFWWTGPLTFLPEICFSTTFILKTNQSRSKSWIEESVPLSILFILCFDNRISWKWRSISHPARINKSSLDFVKISEAWFLELNLYIESVSYQNIYKRTSESQYTLFSYLNRSSPSCHLKSHFFYQLGIVL